ncbi:MAG: hypothetical protein QMD36_03335 [Candidatus Aenigmarchaeota archaeon]|nr:hypothetical protein [Candidatus Aenigmarchaeota archaeon]
MRLGNGAKKKDAGVGTQTKHVLLTTVRGTPNTIVVIKKVVGALVSVLIHRRGRSRKEKDIRESFTFSECKYDEKFFLGD